MKIDEHGEMVTFKTRSPFFELEKSGMKANTVRIFRHPEEQDRFVSSIFSLNKIEIKNPDTGETFSRLITSIVAFTYPDFSTIYIISWEGI